MDGASMVLGKETWVAAQPVDWDTLFAEQLPRVYNYFRYRVGDEATAEDLTSATFEKAWKARHRYRKDLAAFTTWLFVIARRVGTDHFRGRRDHLPLEAAAGVPGGSTPEQIAERRAEADRLHEKLARLPDRERELLALKYGAGMNNREIARHTKLSESNVGTILHRTIHTLRAGWEEEQR
jgi:RNA polymerase sigma-70 factor, ECF subfamily